MRILACAYACNPIHGSEEGVGWGWVNAIAKYHEAWVLTAEYHRRDIEKAIECQPEKYKRLHFAYVKEKPWHYRPTPIWIKIEGSIIKPIMNWAYRLWLRDAIILGKQLHFEVGFDLAHQITYLGFRFPGHLWRLDIPFVWGPIGGLENTPWTLLSAMGLQGAVYYGARNVVNSLHRRFLREPRRSFAAAKSGVIAATEGIRREIQRWYGVDAKVICEVGLPLAPVNQRPLDRNGEPLRIAWSGRLLPGKALNLLLQALSNIPTVIDWRLEVYGDGPCRVPWQRLAERKNLNDRVVWHGQVSRQKAVVGVQSAHLFVTTSLKDLTSTVILEALANGVPVVCPDHCGFADVVNERCGIKIPIPTAREFVKGLGQAIVAIASDEAKRHALGIGALLRAKDYSWEAKAEVIDCLYKRVLNTTDTMSDRFETSTMQAPAYFSH